MLACDIIREVARARGVTRRALFGPDLRPHVVACRRAIVVRLRLERGLDWAMIGRLMQRDRTTVRDLVHPRRRGKMSPEMSPTMSPSNMAHDQKLNSSFGMSSSGRETSRGHRNVPRVSGGASTS